MNTNTTPLSTTLANWERRESDNTPFWDMGIILFSPSDGFFYEISFGDGSDDEPVDDCDDYLYLQSYTIVNGGEFEEQDGGNMWFHRKDYSGFINDPKMVRDALEFLGCKEPDKCIYLRRI